MSYVIVRNTLSLAFQRNSSLEFYAGTATYIEYQGSYDDDIGNSLQRLGFQWDRHLDPSTKRDTCIYWTYKPPYVVLNGLRGLSYQVVASHTIQETCMWTLCNSVSQQRRETCQ